MEINLQRRRDRMVLIFGVRMVRINSKVVEDKGFRRSKHSEKEVS